MNIRSCSPLPTYSEHGFQVIINDVELSLSFHTSLLAPMRVARGLSHAWSCLMVFLGLCCVAGSFLIEHLGTPKCAGDQDHSECTFRLWLQRDGGLQWWLENQGPFPVSVGLPQRHDFNQTEALGTTDPYVSLGLVPTEPYSWWSSFNSPPRPRVRERRDPSGTVEPERV